MPGPDLEAIRARVAALEADGGRFVTVRDMVSAGQAMESSVRAPAAFVATSSESAEPNRTQGVHSQRVTCQIAVLVVLQLERRAEDAPDAVEAWRGEIIRALAGWTCPGAQGAFDYSGFRVVRMGQGLVWFECSFTTFWALRN